MLALLPHVPTDAAATAVPDQDAAAGACQGVEGGLGLLSEQKLISSWPGTIRDFGKVLLPSNIKPHGSMLDRICCYEFGALQLDQFTVSIADPADGKQKPVVDLAVFPNGWVVFTNDHGTKPGWELRPSKLLKPLQSARFEALCRGVVGGTTMTWGYRVTLKGTTSTSDGKVLVVLHPHAAMYLLTWRVAATHALALDALKEHLFPVPRHIAAPPTGGTAWVTATVAKAAAAVAAVTEPVMPHEMEAARERLDAKLPSKAGRRKHKAALEYLCRNPAKSCEGWIAGDIAGMMPSAEVKALDLPGHPSDEATKAVELLRKSAAQGGAGLELSEDAANVMVLQLTTRFKMLAILADDDAALAGKVARLQVLKEELDQGAFGDAAAANAARMAAIHGGTTAPRDLAAING